MSVEKVALVTAGGSGMGADAARRLAADGFRVGILSSSGKGEALGKELGGFGVTGSNQELDDLAALVEGAKDRWGRVDVLVNSAGHGPKGPVLEISDDDWHTGLDIYLLNVIRPTRLVTPLMQAQGGGVIINISTFAAFEPDPLFPTSGVFRAGLAAFTKLYADKYAAENIRVNTRIPMGRYGYAEEVSSLISWLASEGAAYMTGQNLRIDGGLTRAV
ncbi:SDR family oxidoreductase [Profundibacterium mesophilum]|uniref:3-oxoacyl- reductase n=1 Tax=Profundibacterium mesophilum KAUST100406-0324 TaxID=1037889 RepID=A0A921TCH8_9RHOB|nr:SDR family oxidoreductase [Profundibacterium mesophilum]KAF0674907.1 3-oxoacyl- reductase [Profundibacterium mesophilum KAUST100406-0324]